jgi:hypothetical protein
MTEEKKITLTTDLEIDLLEQVNTLQIRVNALEDALAGARVFVSMDTLPENVPSEGQRQGAVDLLEIIDTLMP